MRGILLGFIAGAVLLHQLPALPDRTVFGLSLLLGIGAAITCRRRAFALGVAGVLAGFGYAGFAAVSALEYRLPQRLEGADIHVIGEVVGLPRNDDFRTVFVFEPNGVAALDGIAAPRRLRLSWYHPPVRLSPGQQWAFTVRLKQPRGLMNPGAFDYERWLFTQRIDAVGYVRGDAALLGTSGGLDALRAQGSAAIAALVGSGAGSAVVQALAVADRRGIDSDLWQVLNATGTGHLLAISGLHIGLAAGVGGLAVSFLWRRSVWLCCRLPPRLAGLMAGLCLAAGYALLAGLALPTRRALVMAAVAAAAWCLRREWRAADVLLWALAAVIALQPLAPLGAGLWLSFWAVVILLLAATVRRQGVAGWGRMQLAVSVGLFPLTAMWFGQLPLVSPLANALAVPAVSLVVVPLVFLGLFLLPVSAAAAAWPFQAAAVIAEWLVGALEWVSAQGASQPLPILPVWIALTACVGMLFIAVPGRWPGRPLVLGLLLPILVYRPETLPHGQARVSIADVGQGTGVVVETRGHTLVYDTGPRMGRTDAGEAALLPLLASLGRSRIDTLVVTHADADHAGGLDSLLDAPLEIGSVLAGEPLETEQPVTPCRRGQQWAWDGVRFAMLHPDTAMSGNDASCVLRVTSAGGVSALMPGDISHAVEARLVRELGPRLNAELLVVPHHGSASSSLPAFMASVAPREAVFTTGYRNRYGLPAAEVLERYMLAGIAVRSSPGAGAVTYRLGKRLVLVGQHRRDAGRYFHAR